MLDLNQYSHSYFHKLFIVGGCLGRPRVLKIHSNGQVFSVMLGILQINMVCLYVGFLYFFLVV